MFPISEWRKPHMREFLAHHPALAAQGSPAERIRIIPDPATLSSRKVRDLRNYDNDQFRARVYSVT